MRCGGRSALSRTQLAVVLVGLACAARAGAQLPDTRIWRVNDTAQVVDLSLATSGGVSIGSYLAGSNATLLEVLRLWRDTPELRAAFRLPHYRVVAATGASAGSINALISAMRWCESGGRERLDEGLYWRVWMPLGLEQLLHDDAIPRELGLFDRSDILNELRALLASGLHRDARTDCIVSVGAIASKLVPTRMKLNDHIEALVQRVVVTYEVAGVPRAPGETSAPPANASSVILPSPPLIAHDSAMGKQIVLASRNQGGGDERFVPLFSFLNAATSIPYVFAPVSLSYCDDGSPTAQTLCGSDRAGAPVTQRARFVDGGSFDNTPLFPALRLLALRDSLLALEGGAPRATAAGALLVTFKARRGVSVGSSARPPSADSPATCRGADGIEHCGGVQYFLQFLGGLKASASQYELQSLIRARSTDATLRERDLDVLTRHSPIVGEKVGEFAAFLGRPFREHDFQVGIYESLHYVASAILCRAEHRQAGDTSGTACITAQVRDLARRLALPCPSSMAVESLLRREYPTLDSNGDVAIGACLSASPEERALGESYVSIGRALDVATAEGNRGCVARATIQGVLCATGLPSFFEKLRVDTSFMDFVRERAAACRQRLDRATSAAARRWIAGDCFADPAFLHILQNPQRESFRVLRTLALRMQALEETVHQYEAREGEVVRYQAGTQFLNFLVHSAMLAEETGGLVLPTIVPHRNAAWRIATGIVLPSYVEMQVLGRTWGLGWQPYAYRWHSGVSVSTRAGVTLNAFPSASKPNERTPHTTWFTAEGLLGVRPRWRGILPVSAIEGGVRYWAPRDADRADGRALTVSSSLSPMLRVGLLWDRLGVAITTPPSFASPYDPRHPQLSVVLNDAGGLLYWTMRSARLR